jgi:hypothetical protein
MKVRAKFKCVSKNTVQYSDGDAQIFLLPVSEGSEENEKFYSGTPAGQIELLTINEEAAKQFIVNKEYYVDFTLAETEGE